MDKIKYENCARKMASYVLLIAIVFYIITGYGMTRPEIAGKLTFGLLTKQISYRVHTFLIIPLVLSMAVHLYYSCRLCRIFGKK